MFPFVKRADRQTHPSLTQHDRGHLPAQQFPALRHRKNSLFYKTLAGARVGDIHLSLYLRIQRDQPLRLPHGRGAKCRPGDQGTERLVALELRTNSQGDQQRPITPGLSAQPAFCGYARLPKQHGRRGPRTNCLDSGNAQLRGSSSASGAVAGVLASHLWKGSKRLTLRRQTSSVRVPEASCFAAPRGAEHCYVRPRPGSRRGPGHGGGRAACGSGGPVIIGGGGHVEEDLATGG